MTIRDNILLRAKRAELRFVRDLMRAYIIERAETELASASGLHPAPPPHRGASRHFGLRLKFLRRRQFH